MTCNTHHLVSGPFDTAASPQFWGESSEEGDGDDTWLFKCEEVMDIEELMEGFGMEEGGAADAVQAATT